MLENISGNAMETQIEKGFEIGFDDYITKPINVSMFLEKILNLLTQKNKLKTPVLN